MVYKTKSFFFSRVRISVVQSVKVYWYIFDSILLFGV